MCTRNNNEIIAIKEILSDHFVIPTYQRGYRWTRFQIEDLLNDIKDFEDDDNKSDSDYYCLQPLVVKETANGEYRIIDGQQRLTTIWLLLSCLGKENKFELKYERSNALEIIDKFSFYEEFTAYELTKQNINSNAIKEWNVYVNKQWKKLCENYQNLNIEVFHIYSAWLFIKNWLKDNDKEYWCQEDEQLNSFVKNVKVIWHSVDNEIETFQNLNSGKIPLTDAELIKALFLSTYGNQNAENQLRQKLIAEEYDSIERQLRIKDFWYFLNGSGPQPTSCISFIFELLQKIEKGNDVYSDQQFHTYLYFRDIINSLGDATKVWERVTDIFHVLEGWYNMPEIYNLVGFLRAKDRSIREIYEAYLKCETIDEFKKYLIFRCLECINWYDENLTKERNTNFEDYLIRNFRYDNNYDRVWNLLLLINIATLNMVKTEELNRVHKISKFSFADFHNCKWQIEHISPRQAKVTEDLEIPGIAEMPPVGTKITEIDDMMLKEKIDPYVASLDESVMCLSNLTFLSNHINASIGNHHYTEKRDLVLKKQSEGFYLLPSSMMVFTKAYTDKAGYNKEIVESKTSFWSDIDRKAYLCMIKNILSNPYFEVKKDDLKQEKQYIESSTPAFSYTSSIKQLIVSNKEGNEAIEKFNYSKLLEKYDYIIIPKIQRDYAQGRQTDKDERAAKIRENLIKDIFNMGTDGLDFQIIFGTQEIRQEINGTKTEEKKVFVPIDGQQRLTTLFLLDLYKYKKDICYNNTLVKRKPIFIYETRNSASDFCVDVVNNKWIDFPDKNSPKEAITKATWFQHYWADDPTVEGMLVMLDAIHAEAKQMKQLPNIDNIHFAYFNIGQENISDTIYLKMNTRGKELTSFENLKATLEKEFKDLSQEWKRNIDGKWQDAFWKSENPTELPDMRILRFIANTLFVKLCDYEVLNPNISLDEAIKCNEPQEGEDDYENKKGIYNRLVITRELYGVSEKRLPQYVGSTPFVIALKCIDQNLEYLSSMLDCFAENYDVQPYWKEEVSQILDSNYKQRAVLYAVSLFLKYCGKNKEGYQEWLRFVWNIAEHDSTDYKEFIRTCRLFDKLAEKGGCKNIMKILQIEEVKEFSSTDQFKEELVKASVYDNLELFEQIKKAESHAFFHGTIRFIYGSGTINWDSFTNKVMNLKKLVPANKYERETISFIIPYIIDNDLKELFSKYNLSNDDTNLMSIFLSETARSYLDSFFLIKNTESPTNLQKQLMILAPIHPDFRIRNHWGNHKCVLTNYKNQSGYYVTNSYPLDDDIYYRVQDILREGPFIFLNENYQESRKNDYLVGLEIDFRYNDLKFRYYNENHTIRLMGNDWAQKLYSDIEGFTFCCVNSFETKDSLIAKLDTIVKFSKDKRFEHIKEIYEYFKTFKLTPLSVGCNSVDKTDELFNFSSEKVDYYEWVSIEILFEKFAIAFTIDRNHRIEVGLRKCYGEEHKDDNVKLQMPHSHREYSEQNDWWYFVYSYNHFDEKIVKGELNCLINQYCEL